MVILGLVALAGLGLIGLLAVQEKPIPGELVGLAAGASGAIGALLVRTSSEGPAEAVPPPV